jgi:hypothetical protein
MNKVRVAKQPDGAYMVVEAGGSARGALDRHLIAQAAESVPPRPNVYSQRQLGQVLSGFGLTDKANENGIREADETGGTTFHW